MGADSSLNAAVAVSLPDPIYIYVYLFILILIFIFILIYEQSLPSHAFQNPKLHQSVLGPLNTYSRPLLRGYVCGLRC